MAEFAWEARARTGEVRKGVMEADSEDAVNQRLRQQQLNPVKVKKKAKDISITIGSGVTTKDLVTFTRLFATMIDAGLPLVQCLDILSGQQTNKIFAGVLRDVKNSVEQGASFSDALRKHPKVFDELFVNLVHAGEVGGILDTIMQRLSVYLEKRQKLVRQVRGAMVYPSIVIVIAGGVMTVLLTFVIPAFERMFADFGGGKDALPKLTQIIVAMSHGFVSYLPFIVVALLIGTGSFIYFYRTPGGKRAVHSALLKAPIMGPVLRKIAVARFTRTLGTLLQSGVPILDALDICARTSGNVVIESGIQHVRTKISEGKNMAEPLSETKVFPDMVVQMIAVGEQTGALDQMLNKIADFYEEETDIAVAAMTSAIEPILMVGVGGMVGVVLIAMYLPIFSLAGNIKAD
ncbi:MAG: type II secretion system F family protein [Polyangiaceae bacterium]|nr:type II secretion system F family protein [Polyangiaceae bacterium]MBK9000261.1 type II secretion system F family protein [Myxococcales bacterium]MCL4751434.1 type II secretion system F family protein [Myxococcales bacterium]